MVTAIFICDIQTRFTDIITGFTSVVDIAGRTLDVARVLELPTVVTEQYRRAMGETVPELAPLVAAAAAVAPQHVEEKFAFTMVSEPVKEFLTANKVEEAVITGVESHVCVSQTALDLINMGIRPIVLADGVSSQRLGDREVALTRLARRGVDVTNFEAWLFEHIKTSKHPQFKALSGVIRKEHLNHPWNN